MTKILFGKPVVEQIYQEIDSYIKSLGGKNLPKLDIILVGEDPASLSYVTHKIKACEKHGVLFELHKFDSIEHNQLLNFIEKLNQDTSVSGILLQLPLPENIYVPDIIKVISKRKDVDGFHAYNLGKMLTSKEFEDLAPCTPKAVIALLDYYKIPIKGQNITVIGHSNIVGKPLAVMLMNRNATVTVCHIYTKNLKENLLKADIIISAVGKINLVDKSMVNKDAVLIDVGFNQISGGICGDFNSDLFDFVKAYSPVPKGVGPITVAQVVRNTIVAHKWLNQK